MTDFDQIARLVSTYSTDDLRAFVAEDGPFLTVIVPSPSDVAGAGEQLDVRWRNARRQVEEDWPSDLLEQLDEEMAELRHDVGDAIAVMQRADGRTLVEPLLFGVSQSAASIGPAPRLAPVLENRQRTLPHVVVRTDRAGAEVIAFDAGSVQETDAVEGDTLHIHRGHPGGWSQRRFQQRAENTWERNADTVAEHVREMIERVAPVLIVVAGEVRARTLVVEALEEIDPTIRVVSIEAGDDDGIAAETVRTVDDHHARLQRAALERLRESESPLAGPDEVITALRDGRVDTLLVAGRQDDHADVDEAITLALATSARIVVVPTVPDLAGGVAAITRW